MFTKEDSSLSHTMTLVPGSSVLKKKQRTCEKQHLGILLLNTPQQQATKCYNFEEREILIFGNCIHPETATLKKKLQPVS